MNETSRMSGRQAGLSGARTIGESIHAAARSLSALGESARLEAELLVTHAAGLDRTAVYAHPEHVLGGPELDRLAHCLRRRAAGEPLSHITGWREFWSLELEVSADTLAPRPETEHLVECVLALVAPDAPAALLDAGTGTGAIAIAIASERDRATVHAVEASAAALEVARRNAERHVPGRVAFALGDWFEGLGARRFDVVASNPPYVASTDACLGRPPLVYEPALALAAGPDGLDAIRHIVGHAPAHLHDGGWLVLEHGATQGDPVRGLLRARGFERVRTLRDYAGNERVTSGLNARQQRAGRTAA